MSLDRKKMVAMCDRAKLGLQTRVATLHGDIVVADGFSAHPWVTFRKFGVEKGDFSMGAYATLWWLELGEDKVLAGAPLLFDALHDMGESWDLDTKKRARINAAVAHAREFIADYRRVSVGG